jgi:pyruvate/2-oxoglutarate dehydrogenase complex dihydrolipoamide dehydrogenase (E3) component
VYASTADKQLTVIYSGKKMLERYCKGAHKGIKKYLSATANVRVLKDQKVVASDGNSLVTTKVREKHLRSRTSVGGPLTRDRTISQGEKIRTDVAFFCVGFVPNTEFMQAGNANLLSERGHIKVNEHMQVEGHPNIFALGDVADVDEEKLAQAPPPSSFLPLLFLVQVVLTLCGGRGNRTPRSMP